MPLDELEALASLAETMVGLSILLSCVSFIVVIGLVIAIFQMNGRVGKLVALQRWTLFTLLVNNGNTNRWLLDKMVRNGALSRNDAEWLVENQQYFNAVDVEEAMDD